MTTRISESLKYMVIKEWLKGNHRDRIANQTGLSGGTVSNIVREWRDRLANYEVDEMREFSVMCRKADITPSQCVSAYRATELMRKMGFDEEDLQFFIGRFYLVCKETGLKEDKIASLVAQLVKLSDRIPIDQLPGYIEETNKEKETLEKAVERLRTEVLAMQNRHTNLCNEYSGFLSEITLLRALKGELRKHGMDLNNITKLVRTTQHISDMGFDVSQIISRVSTIESMEKKQADLRAGILNQEERVIQLQKTNNILMNSVTSHQQLLSIYHQLESMGFGLRELDLLFKTVTEISRENGFSPENAVIKFIDDIINQYRYVGGFESRLQVLKEETEHVQWELAIIRSTLSDLEQVNQATSKLLALGLDLTDIVYLAKNLEKEAIKNEHDYHVCHRPKSDTKVKRDTSTTRDSIEWKKEFNQKLPFTAENELKSVLAGNRLKTELITQVIWIACFRDIRIQIQTQILWSYCCACMMYDQFQIAKIVLEKQNALLPLVAATKGETVPLNELKRSVIIAIQTMKHALKKSENTHDSKSEAASTALQDAETALQQLV